MRTIMQVVSGSVSVFLLLLLPCLVRSQRTFMRSCECEYVTNGKCAYTLLLPIGADTAAATCQSGSSSDGADLSSIQRELDELQMNMTILKDWSSSQARLLAQLQGAIIGIQSGTGSVHVPGDTTEPNTQPGSVPDLEQFNRQVENLGSNVEAIREAQTLASRDISSLNVVLTDTVQRVRSLQDETPNLKIQLEEQNTTIRLLKLELQRMRSQMCQKRGLLVSGKESSIPDADVTASSSFDENHGPIKGRMNNTQAPGAWCPKEPNDAYEWLQFDLGQERVIFGTASKGRYDFTQWVTSYRVEYAAADQPLVWNHIHDVMGDPQIFPGNSDKNSIQTNLFWTPIRAKLIRIIPIGVFNNANKCMRADVIGCVDVNS